jgi:ribA/ribD-fused uncharacterized protein
MYVVCTSGGGGIPKMGNQMIKELSGEYRFLSNFWSCFIEYEGLLYPSVENAYQAAKCANELDKDYFLTCKASDAKRRGRIVKMRPDWEEAKLGVMLQLVRQKFQQEPLRTMLLATGDQEIQEGNWWGDLFWGTVNGVGENHLGKILMKVREELKND